MSDHFAQVTTEFTGADHTTPVVSLMLEQEPFPTDSGDVLSMVEIAEANGLEFIPTVSYTAVSTDIEEIQELYYAQCNGNQDGSTDVTINVFKTPDNLEYVLVSNNGTFGDPVTSDIEKTELIQFQLESSKDLGHNITGIISIAWEGDTYDVNGSVVYPTIPVASGTHLVTNQAVYGSCRVTYKTFGDTYPKRDDSEELQATVMAFYGDGQVETLEVVFSDFSGLCADSYNICIDGIGNCEQPADGEEEGDGTSTTLQLVAYDYCTGAAISGAKFYIGGKQVPATGHTVKRGVNYSIVVKASGYKDSNTDDLSGNDSFSV
jgi:hypothetical protein